MKRTQPVLKFAVVREDPEIELTVARQVGAKRVLTVASGGCTALTLAAAGFDVVAFDVNPAQLAHVDAKRRAVASGDLPALNVEETSSAALNQCGAFEGLFRLLRAAFNEFVLDAEATERWFGDELGDAERGAVLELCFESPYWPACFSTVFNDGLLHAMFGPGATQHAIPGSYPRYFQRLFERGMRRADASHNPFLQHVFLGRYRANDAPEYVRAGRDLPVELIRGTMTDVEGLEQFQLYSLSNVFDWSSDDLVASWAAALDHQAPRGSAVILRQLNNRRDLRSFFGASFEFNDELGRQLVERDRSLFYERIEVGVKR